MMILPCFFDLPMIDCTFHWSKNIFYLFKNVTKYGSFVFLVHTCTAPTCVLPAVPNITYYILILCHPFTYPLNIHFHQYQLHKISRIQTTQKIFRQSQPQLYLLLLYSSPEPLQKITNLFLKLVIRVYIILFHKVHNRGLRPIICTHPLVMIFIGLQ